MSTASGDAKPAATASNKTGPREIFPSDIPVLNELASLIGSIEMETSSRYKFKDTEKVVAEELGQVRLWNDRNTAPLMFVSGQPV